MPPPRFAVDKMLGRLATWLRIIGQDATYGAHLGGRTLLRHARAEGRTVLSRDRRLLRDSPPPPVVMITSDQFRAQLRQVVDLFQIDPFHTVCRRCSRCNTLLREATRAEVVSEVPAYVAETQSLFLRCPHCRRVYWPATHAERIDEELRRMGFHPVSR